tara:strand:+ start:583 stop:897 length:315 start_codon:yes stop_codon:yes gene_type:complete
VDDGDGDCSGDSSQESLPDSSCCNDEVKDDDSPYFVMIVLDSTFLAYLEDPLLMDPTQIHEEINKIVKNHNFLDIIDQEVTRMFRHSMLTEEDCDGHDSHQEKV